MIKDPQLIFINCGSFYGFDRRLIGDCQRINRHFSEETPFKTGRFFMKAINQSPPHMA